MGMSCNVLSDYVHLCCFVLVLLVMIACSHAWYDILLQLFHVSYFVAIGIRLFAV